MVHGNLGHCNSPHLNSSLSLSLSRGCSKASMKSFLQNPFLSFLVGFDPWGFCYFTRSDRWSGHCYVLSGAPQNLTPTVGFSDLADAPPFSWAIRYVLAIYMGRQSLDKSFSFLHPPVPHAHTPTPLPTPQRQLLDASPSIPSVMCAPKCLSKCGVPSEFLPFLCFLFLSWLKIRVCPI